MREFRFYGASDDLFEMEGHESEEIGCYETGAAYQLNSKDGELVIFAQYCPKPIKGATWVIGVTMPEEDDDIPDWPMRFETHERKYSPVLIVEAPDDTTAMVVK